MRPENLGSEALLLQSGALYEPWGWYLSEKANAVQLERLKQSVNCTLENIFDCYKSLPGDQVLRSSTSRNDFLYHPMPDDDFFPSDITEEKYDLASRLLPVIIEYLSALKILEGFFENLYEVLAFLKTSYLEQFRGREIGN